MTEANKYVGPSAIAAANPSLLAGNGGELVRYDNDDNLDDFNDSQGESDSEQNENIIFA